MKRAIQEVDLATLKVGMDEPAPEFGQNVFLKARERIKQLRRRGTRYSGLRGMSVFFRTFSNEYDENGKIYTQEIKLLDLPEALGLENTTLKEKVLLAMKGDVAVRCTCLTGDVGVPLLDGRELTMEELLREYGTDRKFWVYSVDHKGDFVPAQARCLGETARVRSLVKVTIDNDRSFTCTPDHLVMLRDGTYRPAGDLQADDSLMPVYRRQRDGYEDHLVNSTGRWRRTYYEVASKVNRQQLRETWKRIKAEGEKHIACHHDDENKSNNTPENLKWMGKHEHWMHHAFSNTKQKQRFLRLGYEARRRWVRKHRDVLSKRLKDKWASDYDGMVKAITEAANRPESRSKRSEVQTKTWSDPKRRADRIADMKKSRSTDEYRKMQRGAQREAWSDPELREKHSSVCRQVHDNDETRARHSEASKEKWRDPELREKNVEGLKKAWSGKKGEERKRKLRERWADPEWRAKMLESRRRSRKVANHKVKSVVFIETDEPVPVYDLRVEVTQNFLINSEIVVHNCPSFLYWGFAYILTQFDAKGGDPEERRPQWYTKVDPITKRMKPDRTRIRNFFLRGTMCKHLGFVAEVFGSHWNSIVRDLRSQGYE